MQSTQIILHIAVPTPLHKGFDYLPPLNQNSPLTPGIRLKVPFGKTKAIGILLELRTESDIALHKLRPAELSLDTEPLLPVDLFQLARWASDYYHHPIGEVFHTLLPAALRQGHHPQQEQESHWRLTEKAWHIPVDFFKHAPLQAAIYRCLQTHPDGLDAQTLSAYQANWRKAVKAMLNKKLVQKTEHITPLSLNQAAEETTAYLNQAQQTAVNHICDDLQGYRCWLLDGVTGSGKTEVYMHTVQRVLENSKQVLVLVPEIGLTPQLLDRFRNRFKARIGVWHSALSDRERLNIWLYARDGQADIIIGTRSAIFLPLARPGVIIIDEEHDASYKQQESFRYHARDLAVYRARQLDIPIILGSATPSLESLNNVAQQRYSLLHLPERAGTAVKPRTAVLDMKHIPASALFNPVLLNSIRQHLMQNNQILLFLNRRGYSPVLMCHDCGWTSDCQRCDARMTYHKTRQKLHCHHCGAERPAYHTCPSCASKEILPLGAGTEQIEAAIENAFPGVPQLRIDRDTTRRKGELERSLERARTGDAKILIGTQMLAKGHHFPNVTLVGILNIDQGLFSADFRGPEYMAQQITQVAGRAGRATQPGEVLIQTCQPDHPLLHTLITKGYAAFAQQALNERQSAGLPPYTHFALLRAEAVEAERAFYVLRQVRESLQNKLTPKVDILGPATAPMERRAGRYRAQLLLQSGHRTALHTLLKIIRPQLENMREARSVRWSLDIDPIDMF